MTEDYAFGNYGTEAVQFDRVAVTHPYYLPVVAAGNDRVDAGPTTGEYRALDQSGTWRTHTVAERRIPADGGTDGFDTIAGAGNAKNVLTVGAIGLSITGAPRMSSFSSFGPTDDGRIKPDLVGYGERVFSSSSSGTNQYAQSSGTSMATPNVSGSLALLQEHHHNLTGSYLRAATLKGLAIHTAKDLGHAGPDYRHGWGLLDTRAAAELITRSTENATVLLEEVMTNGGTFAVNLTVERAGPVRVTLSWTDPPSTRLAATLNNRSAHLKNDLDLRLVHASSGTTYFPFVLDPDRPSDPAVTGDNRVDPVEQVYLAQAPVGNYTIVVSHKGTLDRLAPQAFSLVTDGFAEAQRALAVGHVDAESGPDEVVIEWQTLFERSSGMFRLERAPITFDSANKKQYGPAVVVGSVDASGSSSAPQHYVFVDRGVLAGRYIYRILFEGVSAQHVAAEVEVNVFPPRTFATLWNYPNPVSDHTHVVVDVPEALQVQVEVFDALGRRLLLLADETLGAGRHHLAVDATAWAAGTYFVRATSRKGVITHQLVVVR
jgi:hypothetical protein